MEISYRSPYWGFKNSIILIVSLALISTTFLIIKDSRVSAQIDPEPTERLAMVQGNSLKSVSDPTLPDRIAKRIKMTITAYSSTPWQTDDTPFITASGSRVKDGIVANNLLPFGTKVRIPELYGDRVFEVRDRMHYRMGYYRLDIWFAETQDARNFGKKTAYIEVLEN